MIKTALQTIKEDMNETNKTASLAVIAEYNEKMKNLRFQQYTSSNRIKKHERKVRAQGVKAEQEALMKMLERETSRKKQQMCCKNDLTSWKFCMRTRLKSDYQKQGSRG